MLAPIEDYDDGTSVRSTREDDSCNDLSIHDYHQQNEQIQQQKIDYNTNIPIESGTQVIPLQHYTNIQSINQEISDEAVVNNGMTNNKNESGIKDGKSIKIIISKNCGKMGVSLVNNGAQKLKLNEPNTPKKRGSNIARGGVNNSHTKKDGQEIVGKGQKSNQKYQQNSLFEKKDSSENFEKTGQQNNSNIGSFSIRKKSSTHNDDNCSDNFDDSHTLPLGKFIFKLKKKQSEKEVSIKKFTLLLMMI